MWGDGRANIQMSMLDPPEVIEDAAYFSGGVPINRTVGISYNKDPVFDYSVAWDNYLTGSTIGPEGFHYNTLNNRYEMSVHRLVIKKYTVKIERI